MRLATIQTLAFICVASTAAAPVVERSTQDLAVFTTAINNINASLVAFDVPVQALTPTSDIPTAIVDLTAKASDVISAINTGTTNIQATDPLTLSQTIGLVTPASAVGKTANSTLNDLISKKDILINGGQQAAVISLLDTLRTSSTAFATAVVAKVPAQLKSTAQELAGSVTTALNNAIVAFGGNV
jgi:hypothetical protein